MVSIKRLIRPDTQTWSSKPAIPLLGLLAAGLTACGGTQAMSSANGDATPAVVIFQSCAKPQWSGEDLAAGHEGTVTISYLVNTEGKAIDSKILSSSGYPGLDEAARIGISKCDFKPATQNGKPVEAWMKMQYAWTQH